MNDMRNLMNLVESSKENGAIVNKEMAYIVSKIQYATYGEYNGEVKRPSKYGTFPLEFSLTTLNDGLEVGVWNVNFNSDSRDHYPTMIKNGVEKNREALEDAHNEYQNESNNYLAKELAKLGYSITNNGDDVTFKVDNTTLFKRPYIDSIINELAESMAYDLHDQAMDELKNQGLPVEQINYLLAAIRNELPVKGSHPGTTIKNQGFNPKG